MAFKVAGSQAFKEGAKKANPVLLEPVMKVEAVTPGDYLGDVTGDLNRRRGIIQGMEETVVGNIIKALIILPTTVSSMPCIIPLLRFKSPVTSPR